LEETFVTHPDSVATARSFVTRWLRAAMPSEDLLIGDVALAVSEACTNVVMHAYTKGNDGPFHVAAEHNGERVCVTVSDDGGGMVPRPDSPGLGLGLPLIASLTDALEVRQRASGSGTVVSMRFSPAGAATRLAS
jgi:serine/threonine-protein kinase RsbW/stage II sporulation protein AB (anti-sigma F factor)